MRCPLVCCSKGALVGAELGSASKHFGDVFAPYISKMKLTGLCYAVGFVDEFCFGNGDEFVKHAVHANIARSRLMN